jgi:hypothetical protein
VHAPEILFALVVPLVREVRAEDEEKRQHDGHAEVPVQVKRHVALRIVRDVFPALTNFHDVRDQPDERGGDDLRDHPRDDRVLQSEDLLRERESRAFHLARFVEEHDALRGRAAEARVPGARRASGLSAAAVGVQPAAESRRAREGAAACPFVLRREAAADAADGGDHGVHARGAAASRASRCRGRGVARVAAGP